ncbi:MAG: hypothetical protein M1831_002416 [Alyxoria varia]|nr:MAG: hypothetical protein M1831_002416 [Alyxoria varia]
MESFSTIPPHAPLLSSIQPFNLHIADQQLDDFKQALSFGKIAPETYENLQDDGEAEGVGRFGLTRKWLVEAKKVWEGEFDWRETETHINTFNNYKVPIHADDNPSEEFTIHFIGMFSAKPDAIPIVLIHGWPGCFIEFLDLLTHFREKYTEPSNLPYHLIVPSLPGYTLSSGPSLKHDSGKIFMASMMHKLMLGLGFDESHGGYIAQGGDLGSFTANIMGAMYPDCKAVHLNFLIVPKPDGVNDETDLTSAEKAGLKRCEEFMDLGIAYAQEQGTRPATLGLVLSSNPLALLSWIGEKFLAWSDPQCLQPSLNHILSIATLYWFTDTIPRCLYPYRETNRLRKTPPDQSELYKLIMNNEKPKGFSWFPWELHPTPMAYIRERLRNIVWYRRHDEQSAAARVGGGGSGTVEKVRGGHFAALERPEVLAQDVEDFVAEIWSKKTGSSSESTRL